MRFILRLLFYLPGKEYMQEKKPDQYEFISEKIKEKPVNKKKLIYHAGFLCVMAVVFGVIASLVFTVCQPWMEEKLYPKEDPQITIPKDEPGARYGNGDWHRRTGK